MHSSLVSIHHLRTENQVNPLGIDVATPPLSWQLSGSQRSIKQIAYQILVSNSASNLTEQKHLNWDSGKVESDQSLGIEYSGPGVKSRRQYFWTVRVWTNSDAEPTAWSNVARWEMGLLSPSDWHAQWIEPEQRPAQPDPPKALASDSNDVAGLLQGSKVHYDLLNPALMVRKSFKTRSSIAKARVYATAHGVYELEMNGSRVGQSQLAPEYTSYDGMLMYQTYDVTSLLKSGQNALGATIADGWYAGRLGMSGSAVNYGDRLGLLLQLEITYVDGSMEAIFTDNQFKSSTGPIQYADLLIGQKYDARLEHRGWSTSGFDDSQWTPVNTADHSLANLIAQYGEPLQKIAEIAAIDVITSPKGEKIVDFGQNVAGHVRMCVTGPAGNEVVLAHTQTLDQEGNFFSNITGSNNENTDVYILKGEGEEVFEPTLTYHGFRYVRVTGFPEEINPKNFTYHYGVPDVKSDLNKLHSNVQWTMRSNLFSVPTDNPDRERAGWSGDLEVIAPTAVQGFQVQSFLTRWLRNMALDQQESGLIPMVTPFFKGYADMMAKMGFETCAAWGDVSVITPWTVYNTYGDRRVLEENFDAGKKWVDYISSIAPGTLSEDDKADEDKKHLWRATAFHFGDWLTPSMTVVNGAGFYDVQSGAATAELVPTIYYAHSSELLGKIANVLGRGEEASRYAKQAAAIKRGFQKAFVNDQGLLTADWQGMYVLALEFEMVEPKLRPRFLARLVEMLHEDNCRLNTGFLSTAMLLPLLSENKLDSLAYNIVLGEEAPSWLYEIRRGATNVWEMWRSIEESGRVTKISQNQPGFSTVGDWLYRYVAGIQAKSPGYKSLLIHPHPDRRIGFAAAQFKSPYGLVTTRWEYTSSGFQLDVEIPPNTTASVVLPGAKDGTTESGQPLSNVPDISTKVTELGLVAKISSGKYCFAWSLPSLS